MTRAVYYGLLLLLFVPSQAAIPASTTNGVLGARWRGLRARPALATLLRMGGTVSGGRRTLTMSVWWNRTTTSRVVSST